jgi:hypothetical protein
MPVTQAQPARIDRRRQSRPPNVVSINQPWPNEVPVQFYIPSVGKTEPKGGLYFNPEIPYLCKK